VGAASLLSRKEFRQLAAIHRIDQVRSHQHDQFLFDLLVALAAEQHADEGEVTQAWDLAGSGLHGVLDQAADGQRLPRLYFNGGMQPLQQATWNQAARKNDVAGGIQSANFRLDLQEYLAIAEHDRQEIKPGAEIHELNTRGAAQAGDLRHCLLAARIEL